MFFRRSRPKPVTFQQRLEVLKQAGFAVAGEGPRRRVSRGGMAAEIEAGGIVRAGIVRENEIAFLVDGGFQKFFRASSGKQKPALASELKALHAFEEDLRDALGLTSLYNQSLGTVSTFYQYDRLAGREDKILK
jgi:hypothetical protein